MKHTDSSTSDTKVPKNCPDCGYYREYMETDSYGEFEGYDCRCSLSGEMWLMGASRRNTGRRSDCPIALVAAASLEELPTLLGRHPKLDKHIEERIKNETAETGRHHIT